MTRYLPKKILEHYLLGLMSISAFFFVLYVAFPSMRTHMIASNEILDMATALLFTTTFVIGLYYSRFVDAHHYRHVYLLITLMAFVGFFSEVRLGLHPMIRDELFQLGITTWTKLILIVSVIIGVATFFVIQYLRRLPDFTEWIRYNIPTAIFLIGFAIFFLASIWLDTHNIGSKRSIVFLEELCELDMAASLLFCGIYLRSIIKVIPNTSFSTIISVFK